MNKAYFKIQDKAKNDRGFKFFKTTKSTLKTLDNLAGFIFDEDEYVYQGTTYPENEEYFGREYISTTNIYPIRFKVVNSTPLEGYWVQGNRTISPSRDALLQNISEGNFEEFVIDQVDSEEIAKIEKDEYDWVATDPVVIQKKLNFDPKILDDTMEILTLVDAGNNFFGVTAFSAVDSPYAQFPQKDVYDRSDLILYIGPKGRLLKDEGLPRKLESFGDDNKFLLFAEYDVDETDIKDPKRYETLKFDADAETSEAVTTDDLQNQYKYEQIIGDWWASSGERIVTLLANYTSTKNLGEITSEFLDICVDRANNVIQNGMSKYIQYRDKIGGVIINLGQEDEEITTSDIRDLIDLIREKFDEKELPICLTNHTTIISTFYEDNTDRKIGLVDGDFDNLESNDDLFSINISEKWAKFLYPIVTGDFDPNSLEPTVWLDATDRDTMEIGLYGSVERIKKWQNKGVLGSVYDLHGSFEGALNPLNIPNSLPRYVAQGVYFNQGKVSNYDANNIITQELRNQYGTVTNRVEKEDHERMYFHGNPFISSTYSALEKGTQSKLIEELEIHLVVTSHANVNYSFTKEETYTERVYNYPNINQSAIRWGGGFGLRLPYTSSRTVTKTRTRTNNLVAPKAGTWFIVEGGSKRVLGHLPWQGGKIFFDYGSFSGTDRIFTNDSYFANKSTHIVSIRAKANQYSQIWVDGKLEVQNQGSTDAFFDPSSYLRIGSSQGHPQNFIIHELMLFKNSVTDRQRQFIESHFAHKWNLTHLLENSHPYKYTKAN